MRAAWQKPIDDCGEGCYTGKKSEACRNAVVHLFCMLICQKSNLTLAGAVAFLTFFFFRGLNDADHGNDDTCKISRNYSDLKHT